MMVSLIIPVYNEEKIVGSTVKTVRDYMENNFKDDYEVIFVDDGSSDGTLDIINESAGGGIKAITYEKNKGKGGAVRTGILAAAGDLVFYTDCDLAYGLDVIKTGCDIFGKNQDADIVIGSRRKHKDGYASYTLLRKIASVAIYMFIKICGGVKSSDSQSGIKGFRNGAAKKIFGLCEVDGWSFDCEVLLIADRLGHKVLEMPVTIINHGDSKIRAADGLKLLKEILKIKKRVKKLELE